MACWTAARLIQHNIHLHSSGELTLEHSAAKDCTAEAQQAPVMGILLQRCLLCGAMLCWAVLQSQVYAYAASARCLKHSRVSLVPHDVTQQASLQASSACPRYGVSASALCCTAHNVPKRR